MAKMKIHELAKELGIQSKDVLSYLNIKGVDAKAPQSVVEEETVKMVKNHFDSSKKIIETIDTKKDSVKENIKSVQEKNGSAAEAAKKKKKIIIVSNSANSKISASQKSYQGTSDSNSNAKKPVARNYTSNNAAGNRQMGTSRTTSSSSAYRPLIKPSVKPSPVKADSPYFTQNRNQKSSTTTNTTTNTTRDYRNKTQSDTTTRRESDTRKTDYNTEDRQQVNRPQQNQSSNYRNNNNTGNNNTSNYRNNNNTGNNNTSNYRSNNSNSSDNSNYRNNNNNSNYRNNNSNSNNNSNYNSNYRNNNSSTGNRSYNNADRNSTGDGRNNSTSQQSYGQRTSYNNNRNSFNRNGDAANGSRNGDTRNGYRDNQKPQNNGQRTSYNNNRNDKDNNRTDGRTDNRFRKPKTESTFEQAPLGKDSRERNNQNRDKRSRKDLIYEEDSAENALKKNRAGRFIKPEKRAEEKVEEQIKVIAIPESIALKDLADKMKMQPSVIIKKLFLQGEIVTVNSEITFEEAESIAIDYDIICEKEIPVDIIEELLKEEEEDEEQMVKRPPVVCVMGHVDHGKTSLLDAIRKTDVIAKEAGGITQAIGAYTVKVKEEKITFLDTPGHEAFTAMRMRGANSTDIAILVVAADDGVMPQTIEAISHAKAANVEIIVAVNKIDKPEANIEKVKQELMEYELVPTDWGGSTEFVPVSAKSGVGIDTLLETIILTAEILELKADKKRNARGLIIEAKLDKGRGPVATVLVQKGTLNIGDFVSAGSSYGKVRAMIDDKGKHIKEAGPSTPVEILGLSDVPEAGEVFLAHENDKTAKTFAETYMAQHKEDMLADTKARMSLDDLFSQIKEGDLKELDLIIKADVQGSVEALKQSLVKLSNEEIVVKCIHGGVGSITESDITLASASNAIIIGFNVKPDAQAKITADREKVDIHLYDVIYKAIDEVERKIKGMKAPVYEEKVIGHAEVRQIFKASSVGNIAGAYVLDGIFKKNCKVRISRAGTQIFEGKLASLKRFKDDVKEVKEGFECGLVFEDFDKMQELDIVEGYEMVEVLQ